MNCRLGNYVFSVKAQDEALAKTIHQILPAAPRESAVDEVVDLDDPMLGDSVEAKIGALLTHAYMHHKRCLWVDASFIITPNQEAVLIVGSSGSGKSTLSLSGHLTRDWKILAEDITLFDIDLKSFVPFQSPFVLKPGATKLIKEHLGLSIPELVLGQWLPNRTAWNEEVSMQRSDMAIALRLASDLNEFSCDSITPEKFLQFCLPISNALRIPGGIAILHELISKAQLFRLVNGSLSERLNFISCKAREAVRRSS